jgi:hypothetical protein
MSLSSCLHLSRLGPSSCLKWHVDLFKKILATGNVKAIPVFIQPNGIAGVKDGLQYMQDGKVSLMRSIADRSDEN